MRDKLLAEHGTKAFALPPSAVIYAAREDLARRDKAQHNAFKKGYLFAWDHVRRAKNVRDLIERAIAEPSAGSGSADLNTRMIYRDLDLLRAALEKAS